MNSKLVVAAVSLALSGCATITRGTSEMYRIETDPPGAIATLSNNAVCKTPCDIRVNRRSSFRVDIIKPGYEDFSIYIQSTVDGAGKAGMAGNIIAGGIIGAGVDAGSGAMHSHQPNPLVVTLVPLSDTATENKVTNDKEKQRQ